MSAMRTAIVLAALDEHLDGQRYLQTSTGRRVTFEVYDAEVAQALAGEIDGLTFGRIEGHRITAVFVGTVRGVPVEVIQRDVPARRAA